MLSGTRRTRWITVLILIGAAGSLIGFVVYLCKPSMVIGSRDELRAVLLMPAEFRSFAAEDYAQCDDSISYELTTERTGLRKWVLRIKTNSEHRAYWEDLFGEYAARCNFRVANRYNRGSNIVLRGYRPNGGLYCWLSIEQPQTGNDLNLAFVYQTHPNARLFRRCIARITRYGRKIWYLFDGYPAITDVRAS